jgi:hypothetical protein
MSSPQYRCPRCRRPQPLRTFPVESYEPRLTYGAQVLRCCPRCGWRGATLQFRAADLTTRREVV